MHRKWSSIINKRIPLNAAKQTDLNQKMKTKNMTTSQLRNSIRDSLQRCGVLLVSFLLTCFALAQRTQAVDPPPDGGYPNFNTAEGQKALFSLTTGQWNTALGAFTLWQDTAGSYNTAVGAAALLLNTADSNTATGAGALLSNTIGDGNTANGAFALSSNTDGENNTATGFQALHSNTVGDRNTAYGARALVIHPTADDNTAVGWQTLASSTGSANTAVGSDALLANTGGDFNTAVGHIALTSSTTGNNNTAVGRRALEFNTTGRNNTAIGRGAGGNLTTGSGNVCIGADVVGITGESNSTRIRNVYSSVASGRAVYVNADNKIGTLASSRRFKDQIKPMDKGSEAILALKPVTFRYKKEIEPNGAIMFGLIAEEVEKVNPELVTRNDKGEAETVRYEAVNAMLLNEFLKEHRAVQELRTTVAKQEATITQQQRGMDAATARGRAGSANSKGERTARRSESPRW